MLKERDDLYVVALGCKGCYEDISLLPHGWSFTACDGGQSLGQCKSKSDILSSIQIVGMHIYQVFSKGNFLFDTELIWRSFDHCVHY